ncbi:hypothetical protein MTBLM5_510009 [Magnetospirillum sp. LM-5]|nr:hypothetical protein MTBLM5_510009 [Magnetospirillum sp. LM-5]
MLLAKFVQGDSGFTAVPTNEVITVNIGSRLRLQGEIEVTDQWGRILCRQNLVNTHSTITGLRTVDTTSCNNTQRGSFTADINLAANPVVFSPVSEGPGQFSMTGTGCTAYAQEAVKVGCDIAVRASQFKKLTGNVYPPVVVNGYLAFEKENGSQSTIGFGDIVNSGTVAGDFGILQLVTSSRRYADLSNGTVQYIADFAGNRLDDLSGVTIAPLMRDVLPGTTCSVTLQDSPSIYLVRYWKQGEKKIEIRSFTLDDMFVAYLMYRAHETDAQWVPLAKVGWSVRGRAKLPDEQEKSNKKWVVDSAYTRLTQPTTAVLFPEPPTWNGTAQGSVLAEVPQGQDYYEAKAHVPEG